MRPIAIVLAMMLAGCADPPLVRVKVVAVYTAHDYNAADNWHGFFPHTILENLDTGERFMKQGETWGKVGDEFNIRHK